METRKTTCARGVKTKKLDSTSQLSGLHHVQWAMSKTKGPERMGLSPSLSFIQTAAHTSHLKPFIPSIIARGICQHICSELLIQKRVRKKRDCPHTLWSQMIRKRYQDAKAGYQMAKSLNTHKFLKKVGLGKEDYYFWKQIGKALLCTYTLFGVAWLYNEKSPLGWWTLKPRPKEEKELAHLYERREFPYPGDEEAMEEFVAKGGMIGTTIGPKGIIETDKDSYNYQKELQNKKFEQEAQKLWFRMRNEVISELQQKGYDIE